MADDPDLTPAAGLGAIASPSGTRAGDASSIKWADTDGEEATTTIPGGPITPDGAAAPRPAAARPAAARPAVGESATSDAASPPAAHTSGGSAASASSDTGEGANSATPLVEPKPATPSATRPASRTDTPTVPRPASRPLTPPPATPVTPPVVTPPLTSAPAPARPKADWAAEVADRIDDVVAKVRANTSDRLVGIARMVVYGLLAAVMGLTALVLAVILFFRLLSAIPGEVWIPYLVLGAILVAVGLLLWSKRTATSPKR